MWSVPQLNVLQKSQPSCETLNLSGPLRLESYTLNDLITGPKMNVILSKHFSSDYGTKTCAGYPGTINHIQQDMDVS